VKYVVDFNVVRGDEILRPGQRDIESDHIWLDDPRAKQGNVELAKRLVARRIVLPDGDQIVVTDIRPA